MTEQTPTSPWPWTLKPSGMIYDSWGEFVGHIKHLSDAALVKEAPAMLDELESIVRECKGVGAEAHMARAREIIGRAKGR